MSIYPTKKQLDKLAVQKPTLFIQYLVFSKQKAWAKYMRNANKKYFKLYLEHGEYLIEAFGWSFTPEGYEYWNSLEIKFRDVLLKIKRKE